jgi:hypothetical protein
MDLVPSFDRVAEVSCQIDHFQHCWPTRASLGTLPGGRLLALAVASFGVVGPKQVGNQVGANSCERRRRQRTSLNTCEADPPHLLFGGLHAVRTGSSDKCPPRHVSPNASSEDSAPLSLADDEPLPTPLLAGELGRACFTGSGDAGRVLVTDEIVDAWKGLALEGAGLMCEVNALGSLGGVQLRRSVGEFLVAQRNVRRGDIESVPFISAPESSLGRRRSQARG